MKLQQYIDYAKHIGLSQEGRGWLNTTLRNYLEKRNPETSEVEHVIDYLAQNEVKKISQMSYLQAVAKADKWTKALQKKAERVQEDSSDTEVIYDFKDGFKIVKLIGKRAYEREGYLMRHCVASYYGTDKEIYSLRDSNNNPHCTIEKDQQVKGKGNGDIHPKYVGYVVRFLEHIGMTVGDSEMLHLGYINLEKYKKYLSKDIKLFNGKYFPKTERIIDKDGGEFASFDLWDQIPLIDNNTLKINFSLETFIKLSFDFLLKTSKTKKNIASGNSSKAASSGDSSKAASSGNYSTAASSGNSSKAASSGYYSKAASSGDSSKAASSGNYSKAASSGDYSKAASSGDYSTAASSGYSSTAASSGNYSKAASSGNYSKAASSGYSSTAASSGNYSTAASSGDSSTAASSGDSSKAASSGNYSKAASSGDSSTAASSGNYSKAASSGDYSKAASSGNSSKAEVNGEECIASAIGHETKARASIGSWIVLSEYYKDGDKWRVLAVKTAKIDGKKLKADTWYMLKNKKFVEVEV